MVTFSNSLMVNPENEKARKQLEKLSEEYSSLLLDYAQMTGPLKASTSGMTLSSSELCSILR